MNKHVGAHPRIGAVDVIPLIPIRGISLRECAAAAWELGEAVGGTRPAGVFLRRGGPYANVPI